MKKVVVPAQNACKKNLVRNTLLQTFFSEEMGICIVVSQLAGQVWKQVEKDCCRGSRSDSKAVREMVGSL